MVIKHCPGHAHRPPLPALATHWQARPSSLQVGVQDLREGGERRNRGAAQPSPPYPPTPSPTLSLEQTVQGGALLPPASSQFPGGKGGLKARSGGCGWFGERRGEKPTAGREDPG